MAMQAIVTVLIACHNCEAWIGRAVGSALGEEETAEVIVVDDASSDRSMWMAHAADDGSGRLRVVRLPRNKGPANARNHGIALARSPWLSILDADDWFLPARLARLLSQSDGADFVADDPLRMEEESMDVPAYPVLDVQRPRWIGFEDFVWANVPRPGRAQQEMGYVKPLVRRQFLEAHALHYNPSMRLGEDYEFYAHALALGARFLLVPAAGYIALRRRDSLSINHSIDDLRKLRDCDTALALLPGITPKDLRALKNHRLTTETIIKQRQLFEAIERGKPLAAAGCLFQPWPVTKSLVLHLCWRLWQWILNPDRQWPRSSPQL